MMTRSQGEALVALLGQLRKDWDLPGIRSSIQKAQTLGSPADVSVAACRVAANLEAKTPGLIPQPGGHWQGTAVAGRIPPVMCPDHPEQRLTRCQDCAAAASTQAHEHAERVRQALREARKS